MDSFTYILSKLLIPQAGSTFVNYKPNLDTTKNPIPFILNGHQFFFEPNRPLELAMWTASLLPFRDHNRRLDPIMMIEQFKKTYSHILSNSDILFSQDSCSVLETIIQDPGSDYRLKLFIKQGPGSIRIMPIGNYLYKIDLSEMEKFPVRKGFIPYGGSLIFDNNFTPLSITYDNNIYMPSDLLWPQAKYIFRSSLIVSNTIKIHAGYFHLFYGSNVPNALHTLPSDHCLRRFMIPFTYKNISTAELAKTVLYGKDKYFHRVTAFTIEGLNAYNKWSFDNFSYESFATYLSKFNDEDFLNRWAFASDGAKLFSIIHIYVKQFLTPHYDPKDPHLITFLQTLKTSTQGKISIENDFSLITEFLTHYIFINTSLHEIVGNNILKNVFDPRVMSTKLRRISTIESMYPDTQTYNQTMLIAIATSMARLPKLLDDFSYIYENSSDKEIIRQFQLNLQTLAADIDNENKNRIEPYYGAHPKHLEISMCV